MPAKLNIDATKALVFMGVFIGVCILIGMDKLSSEYLKFLLAWLIPGPLNFDNKPTEPVLTVPATPPAAPEAK